MRLRSRSMSTANDVLTTRALANVAAPTSPMRLSVSVSLVRGGFFASVLANAFAPLSPTPLLERYKVCRVVFTIKASAKAIAPKQPMWLLESPNNSNDEYSLCSTFANSTAPRLPMQLPTSTNVLRLRFQLCNTCAKCSAPSLPRSLLPKYKSCKEVLVLRTRARALAPSGPMRLLWRFKVVRVQLYSELSSTGLNAAANATAPCLPMLLSHKFQSVTDVLDRRALASCSAAR
mmetsp:Transcript_110531/g.191560  ORF Transcript_110531/g.191560 Transcript_110531/m.191560 type:complete len:233 (-) Transcript_110531:114-812(-)